MIVLPFFTWLDILQPSKNFSSQNAAYCTACQCDRYIQQKNYSAQTKHYKICGDARRCRREHVGNYNCVLRFCVELSCRPHYAVDDKARNNVAYRGEHSHAAHHSQRKSDNALHGAHDRAAPESRHETCRRDKEHERKGRAYPPGYVQSIGNDICRRRNESLRKQPEVAAQRHYYKAPELIFVHFILLFKNGRRSCFRLHPGHTAVAFALGRMTRSFFALIYAVILITSYLSSLATAALT